jgi:L-threonylcarbamoyladenylate synthase
MEILDGFEPSSISKAAEIIRAGGVVGFPTETVYGLGADALNPHAVAKVFEVKQRPRFDPLIVHICSKDWIYDIAAQIPEKARLLVERFWPGPLTVILNKKRTIPDVVTAGLSTVGVRMPDHPVAEGLIQAVGRPIAAPSANPFGYISPTRAKHVARMLGDKVPLILDGGHTTFGIESTIVSVQGSRVVVHRYGAISVEEISSLVGHAVYEKKGGIVCEAPGGLPYHYAPAKPVKIINGLDEITNSRSSLLAFRKPRRCPRVKHAKYLSAHGDLREAAANFFSFLIELDRDDVDIIYAEAIPETGLGKAMMDRLTKASKKYEYISP